MVCWNISGAPSHKVNILKMQRNWAMLTSKRIMKSHQIISLQDQGIQPQKSWPSKDVSANLNNNTCHKAPSESLPNKKF